MIQFCITLISLLALVADPITGTWSGEFKLDGSLAPNLITFQLKFDGKSAVSGKFTGLPKPGDVKTGTFDPKTGAVKLQLGIQGDSTVRLTLEGRVSNGVATGRLSGEASGEFRIEKKGTSSSSAADIGQ